MLTVATVLRTGGIYNAQWVDRLHAQVRRHLPIPHQFLCLTDTYVSCARVLLMHNWPHWWSKIELFRLPGPVLYFDLDTLIIGDLTDIANVARESPFVALRDFYRLGNCIGSGVMGWSDEASVFYDKFVRDPDTWMRLSGGDQQFVERAMSSLEIVRWQDAVPGQVVSYKAQHCENGPPKDARVLCLHGRPKFMDMPEGNWARKLWEQSA